jgi:histidinol-phosphatase
LNFAHVFDGRAEAAIEVGVKAWDIAPMKIIVEEAGGKYSDLEGGASIYKGSCLVSNGLVHDHILRLLKG